MYEIWSTEPPMPIDESPFHADQCEIIDRMGLDQDSVMIIHMGVSYVCFPGSRKLLNSMPKHRVCTETRSLFLRGSRRTTRRSCLQVSKPG